MMLNPVSAFQGYWSTESAKIDAGKALFATSLSSEGSILQDPEFAEMALYIKELEDQLFEVHKFVERMVMTFTVMGFSSINRDSLLAFRCFAGGTLEVPSENLASP